MRKTVLVVLTAMVVDPFWPGPAQLRPDGLAHAAGGRTHSPNHAASHNRSPGEPTPAEIAAPKGAFERLIAGNLRYLTASFIHPDFLASRRLAVATGQRPFAAILGCADSRVPPEFVFDQGLGDLFVVRVAGNTINAHVIGSLEYAVEHLGSAVVVVLGHERCGAVNAAVDGGKYLGKVDQLVAAIRPAVAQARKQGASSREQLLDYSIRAHVSRVTTALEKQSPLLATYKKAGRLALQGGLYDLDTGIVEWL